MQNTSSLPLLPGPLWHWVVEPLRALFKGQIERNNKEGQILHKKPDIWHPVREDVHAFMNFCNHWEANLILDHHCQHSIFSEEERDTQATGKPLCILKKKKPCHLPVLIYSNKEKYP